MNEEKYYEGVEKNHLTLFQATETLPEITLMDDKEIFIRKAFETDPSKGCELLFRYYYNVLCSHAIRFVYAKNIAEDIVGEVFRKFWEARVFEKIDTSYRAYLFTSVRNASINYLQRELKKHSAIDLSAADNEVNAPANPYQIMKADELNKTIEQIIQSLPPKCQAVFLMSRFEGKKNQEIAEQLNISVKAVEAHITKALDRLRKRINKEYL